MDAAVLPREYIRVTLKPAAQGEGLTEMGESDRWDFIVVGAGIAGASVADALAPECRVVVLEREPQPGYHTTGRSAALFAPVYGPAPIRALTRASAAFMAEPPEGFADSPILTPRGALFMAREDQLPDLTALHDELRAEGNFEELDGTGIRRFHPLVREGVCQALGLLAGHEPGNARLAGRDLAAVEALQRMARDGQEREAGLSMIALARVAGRGPVPADSLTIELRTQLGTWAATARPSRRPWAALALGVLLQERARVGDAPSLGSLALLERRLQGASSPEEGAAAAIALGLAGGSEAIDALTERLDRGDFRIRGLHALALALLPAPEAVPGMRTIVSSGLYRPYLVRDVSTALGLLGADGLAQLLVGKFVSARFMPEKVAALQAMAWVAEPGALDALLAVLKRKRIGGSRVDDTSRAFAIAAIGALGSQRPFPFNAAWAQDIVWNAAPPSLHEAENGGGVLDLF